MSRQVLEQLVRLLPCRLQQAPQVEEESASYLELHMRLLVRIRPFGASPMCRSGCNRKRSLLLPSWWCQVCHGNAASFVIAGAWAPDSPRTRRCLADTARCAATRKLARTTTEAFDANSEDVVCELVGLLLVNFNSREHCVVIRAMKQNFSVKSRAISLSDTVKTSS